MAANQNSMLGVPTKAGNSLIQLGMPWQELVIMADECAELWGYSTDYWLRAVACQPGFPARVGAGWRAGDVIDYSNAHPTTGRRGRRRGS